MIRAKCLLLLLFFNLSPFLSMATDLKPWFGNEYETEIRLSVLYQNYNAVSIPRRSSLKRCSNDLFTTLSAAYPFKRYCGEFEATAAESRTQNHRWDNFRVTGRYQGMDELEGDPITATLGLTVTQAFTRALHDLSSFHHGHLEGEAHASFGKKYGRSLDSKDFVFRWWNIFGIGAAGQGSPWMRGEAAWEYRLDDSHQVRAFVTTLWGMGKDAIRPHHHFKGYGKIKHKSVDVGCRYEVILRGWGNLSLQYARRVFAYNFPENANLVLLEYYYPFGNQVYTNY